MIANIEDFRAEYEADQAAAAAKAQQEREAKEEADRKVRQEQEVKARLMLARSRHKVREGIAAAAKEFCTNVVVNEDDESIVIDGENVSMYVQFVEEHTRLSSWRSSPNGKLRLTVGDFGDRSSYPQRKDGSFNYGDIARKLCNIASRAIMRKKQEANRKLNADAAAAINKEFNLPDYLNLVSPSVNAEGKVTINFAKLSSINATPDAARKVLQTLRGLGIKLSHNDK